MLDPSKRYEAARAYVERAFDTVSSAAGLSVIDRYAARLKIEPFRNDRTRIDARWLRATTENERAATAREMELLADRVKELLPGAPSDWTRTNLTAGEADRTTPGTSYGQAVVDEAHERVNDAGRLVSLIGEGAGKTLDAIGSGFKLALVGAGIFLGIKVMNAIQPNRGAP